MTNEINTDNSKALRKFKSLAGEREFTTLVQGKRQEEAEKIAEFVNRLNFLATMRNWSTAVPALIAVTGVWVIFGLFLANIALFPPVAIGITIGVLVVWLTSIVVEHYVTKKMEELFNVSENRKMMEDNNLVDFLVTKHIVAFQTEL